MNTQFITGNSARMAKFGRGGAIVRARAGNALTDDIIMNRCPSVFADDKHGSRTEKYTYISTKDLLGGMRQHGFMPVEVRQGGSKDLEKRSYTKHLIRFCPEKYLSLNVGDTVPEVLLINSHDGTSSYQLMLGMFRLICSNGMIVSNGDLNGVKISHRGEVLNDVIEAAYTVVNDAETTLPMIEDMRRIQLTAPEQAALATAAIPLRFEEEAQVRPDQLLRAHRSADQGDDLWRTFNRVQENVLRGGILHRSVNEQGRSSLRRSREVHGIDQDVRLNRSLWTLAEEMRKIKTVH